MGSVFNEEFNKTTLLVIDLEWDFVDKFEQKVDIADWELIEIGAATSTPSRHPRMLPIASKVIIPEIKQTVSKTFTDITNITNEEIRKNGIPLQKALIQFFAVASKFKQWVLAPIEN